MHPFKKNSTCLLMTAIAVAMSAGSFAAQADEPLLQTKSLAPAAGWSKTTTQARDVSAATLVGAVPDSEVLHITVALKLQNKEQLEKFIEQQSNSKTPHWLSSADSTKTYSPTQAQAQAVADYLSKQGFTNVKISPSRLMVSAEGSAVKAQKAFNTKLGKYSVNGVQGIVNTQDVEVPAELNDVVHAVIGMDTLHRMHTQKRPLLSLSKTVPKVNAAAADIGNAYWPDEFATVYHAGTAPTGSLTDVAIVGWCSMANTVKDLERFESDRGVKKVATAIVEAEKPACSGLQDAEEEGEWAMDVQAIVGIGGSVKSLTLYTGTFGNPGVAVDRAVADNKAKIINMSWGGPETSDGEYDQEFLLAQSHGQLFVASSGDNGSYPCDSGGSKTTCDNQNSQNGAYNDKTKLWVSSPANSPYVIAVGGTTVKTDANKGYASEAGWAFSGGGVSRYEAMPSWQKGVVKAGKFRTLPDVAFDADWDKSPIHYFMTQQVYTNSGYDASKPNDNYETGTIAGGKFVADPGQNVANPHYFLVAQNDYTNNGGTSLAAPLFTGAWARLHSKTKGTLAFAPKVIYGLAAATNGTQGTSSILGFLHDVTAGSNGGYKSGRGWDNVTGWGSFDIEKLSDMF